MSRYGAPSFPSLLKDCVLWAPLQHSEKSSSIPKSITVSGNAVQTTSVTDPWGGSRPVGYFDGSEDFLTIPNSPDFDFPGDFTISFRLRYSAKDGTVISNSSSAGKKGWIVYIGSSTKGYYLKFCVGTGSAWGLSIIANTTFTSGQWYHILISRSGSNVYVFRDGTLVGSGTWSNSIVSSRNLTIGYDGDYTAT